MDLPGTHLGCPLIVQHTVPGLQSIEAHVRNIGAESYTVEKSKGNKENMVENKITE